MPAGAARAASARGSRAKRRRGDGAAGAEATQEPPEPARASRKQAPSPEVAALADGAEGAAAAGEGRAGLLRELVRGFAGAEGRDYAEVLGVIAGAAAACQEAAPAGGPPGESRDPVRALEEALRKSPRCRRARVRVRRIRSAEELGAL
ncbi:unnamed protein product [Prorocentrum cordatum]|uniref:Uncharacterized protein n=1 Tax=Prorocentrum cordatum TaxID=2364126 RepID=A0ABN9S6X0_9DINO|nr:unnamed protein product [Polarella glacialis]